MATDNLKVDSMIEKKIETTRASAMKSRRRRSNKITVFILLIHMKSNTAKTHWTTFKTK